MPSAVRTLRGRVRGALGLLIGLQVAGTVIGLASWEAVRRASAVEEEIAAQREALMQLGAATREVYVHEAHTLIERGPGHLDHLAAVENDVDTQLAQLQRASFPPGADLGAVRASVAASNQWFAEEVIPRTRDGALDQETAVRLHAEAERRAAEIEAHIEALASILDAEQSRQRETIAGATSRAWVAAGTLTIGGALLAAIVASRLARSILVPVQGLQASASAFAAGAAEIPRAPEGEDELGNLGRAFNRMVEAVRTSERRRMEIERLAALGQMSGAVAHELMNPLAVIVADPAMRAPEVAASRAEAEHARRVVQGLLGFARPGEEAAELIDLGSAAADSASRLLPAADLLDISISVDADPMVTTVASPSAVRQVLDNLVRNAIEASLPGSTVEIVVRHGPLVEVRDRGTGIPEAVRSRLYEPFVTGRAEGTGLGLAVCQRIAHAHGGRIEHRVRADGGTVAVWTVQESTHA